MRDTNIILLHYKTQSKFQNCDMTRARSDSAKPAVDLLELQETLYARFGEKRHGRPGQAEIALQ